MAVRGKGDKDRRLGVAVRAISGPVFAITASGCPMGADLENEGRFKTYVGGSTSTPIAGAPSSGGASGLAGTGGSAGALCDVTLAMTQACARIGCHTTTNAMLAGNLDLQDFTMHRTNLVDRLASHGDIGCQASGQAFRECTADELIAKGCPENAPLISSANFESSWLVTKMNDAQGDCGDDMPAPPGDTMNWSEERKLCLLDYFRSLTLPP